MISRATAIRIGIVVVNLGLIGLAVVPVGMRFEDMLTQATEPPLPADAELTAEIPVCPKLEGRPEQSDNPVLLGVTHTQAQLRLDLCGIMKAIRKADLVLIEYEDFPPNGKTQGTYFLRLASDSVAMGKPTLFIDRQDQLMGLVIYGPFLCIFFLAGAVSWMAIREIRQTIKGRFSLKRNAKIGLFFVAMFIAGRFDSFTPLYSRSFKPDDINWYARYDLSAVTDLRTIQMMDRARIAMDIFKPKQALVISGSTHTELWSEYLKHPDLLARKTWIYRQLGLLMIQRDPLIAVSSGATWHFEPLEQFLSKGGIADAQSLNVQARP